EQVGAAEGAERISAVPVGLADDADAEALRLQAAADYRHAEAGVIDIGVASHHDDVAAVPAELIHLGATHRQERRRAEAFGPVFAIGKQLLGGGGRHVRVRHWQMGRHYTPAGSAL